jgi:hypothetical protein
MNPIRVFLIVIVFLLYFPLVEPWQAVGDPIDAWQTPVASVFASEARYILDISAKEISAIRVPKPVISVGKR